MFISVWYKPGLTQVMVTSHPCWQDVVSTTLRRRKRSPVRELRPCHVGTQEAVQVNAGMGWQEIVHTLGAGAHGYAQLYSGQLKTNPDPKPEETGLWGSKT